MGPAQPWLGHLAEVLVEPSNEKTDKRGTLCSGRNDVGNDYIVFACI